VSGAGRARARNPVFEEGRRVFLEGESARRATAWYLVLSAVLLLAVWPQDPLQRVLETAAPPRSFQILSVWLLFGLSLLNARWGAEIPQRREIHTLEDWLRFSPLPLRRLLSGKLALAALHALLLLALSAPLLVVPLGVSARGLEALGQSLLVLAACSLASRLLGFLFLTLLEDRPMLLDFGLMLTVAGLLLATLLAPPASPILALLETRWSRSLAVAGSGLGACLLLLPALSLRLPRLRRRAAPGGRSAGGG
jgi:hypothetical protein